MKNVKDNSNSIEAILTLVKENMADIALHCLDSFLGIDAIIKEPWSITTQLYGNCDYTFVLTSFNDRYESTLCIGAPLTSMVNLFDCDVTLDEAKDAVSELANIFCAVLMDNAIFSDEFGILVQTPPEEAVKATIFPQETGVEGKIWYEKDWLYFGYSIRPNTLSMIDLL